MSVAPAPETSRGAALLTELGSRLSSAAVLRANEPLAKRTTLRVGGPADVYAEPASEDDLAGIIRFCHESTLPFFMLGRGSNLLVRDNGFRGVVICLVNERFSRIEANGRRFHCGAGAKLKAIANEAKQHSVTGMEFLEGIPGSVGGALRMNAGAMGVWVFDIVESARFMDFKGEVHQLDRRDIPVRYRGCTLFEDHIALSAVLKGQPGSRELIEAIMNQFSKKRWSSQPAAPSAGCVFKNPSTIPAGKLIDELGLKGTRVGGAMISLEHGNFIVNDRGAKAGDVLALIDLIRQRAKTERNIDLETEVEIVGE